MRYLAWAIRLIVFVLVVLFAYKNMGPVDVVFFDGLRLSGVPLILVILIAFVIGTLLGVVLMVPQSWSRWRESSKLKRDLSRAQSQPSAAGKVESNQSVSTAKPL